MGEKTAVTGSRTGSAHRNGSAVNPNGSRDKDLRAMLEERRWVIFSEVQGRIRGFKEEASGRTDKPEIGQASDAETDIQADIEFALIQMKAETLNKINDALMRLDESKYGFCADCGDEIAEARLRALPFAVRCMDCETKREFAVQRDCAAGRRPGGK